jgi:5-methylcytosine-specific restriction endonuclease McrA
VAFVDAQVGPFAHKTGPAQTQRLVDEAIARFMPDYAAEQRDRAAEQRYFTIDHDQVSFAGTSRVHGELDLADALDLEDAIRAGAEQLKALGNAESLDVRRSIAVGMLARGEQALEFDATNPQGGGFEARSARTSTTGGREVVLYVHLSEDALLTRGAAKVDNAGGHLLTAAQVAAWCGRADTAKVTVKPVIDLNQPRQTNSYRPTETIAEQIRLRDRTCVFPWCHRPASSCQIDHIIPWDEGGATATWNLALLCVKHHRLKTHGGWTYTMTAPATFRWCSPLGYRHQRDPSGTTDLTPRPHPHPPERRAS